MYRHSKNTVKLHLDQFCILKKILNILTTSIFNDGYENDQ